MDLKLIIPPDIAFDDLSLTEFGEDLHCDWSVFARVCAASGLVVAPADLPDFAIGVLLQWYELHRDQGGARNAIMERLYAGRLMAGENASEPAQLPPQYLH